MLRFHYMVFPLLVTATVGQMQATCPGNRSPPPISWRCPPEMGKSYFRTYRFEPDTAADKTPRSVLPPPEEFESECLASFIANIFPTGPFATANSTCFPYPSCQYANTSYVIRPVNIQLSNDSRILYDGMNDFPECPLLNEPNAMQSYPNGRRFFSQVRTTCREGFILNVSNSQVFCSHDGLWTHLNGSFFPEPYTAKACIPATCKVEQVRNGSSFPVEGTLVGIGGTVITQCNDGLILQGNSRMVCVWSQGTGRVEWDTGSPTCNRATCRDRPTIINSTIHFIKDINEREIKAIVECNVGFNLTGFAEIVCSDGLSWTKLPTCDALSCGRLPIPANGQVSNGSDTVFSFRTYSCNDEFTLQGNSKVSCLPTGDDAAWSGNPPTCTKTRCEQRPSVPNGVVHYIQNEVGIEIKSVVECDVGFNLTGPKEVSCLTGNSLSQSPTCEALRCGNLTIPTNGEVSDGNDTVFSIREYSCNSGFKLEGYSRVSCLPSSGDAEWSGNSPQCTPIRCAIPEETGSNTYTISGRSVNATLMRVCGEGLTTMGTAARCSENGSWTTLAGMVCITATDSAVTPSTPEKQILTNTASTVILAVIGVLVAVIVLLIIGLLRLRRGTSSSVYRPEEDGILMQEPTKKLPSERSIISNTALEDRPSGQEDPDLYDTLKRPESPKASGSTAQVAESDAGDLYDRLQPAPIETNVNTKPTTPATESTGQEPSTGHDLYSTVDTKNTDSGKSAIGSQAVEAEHMYGTVDMSAKRQRSTKQSSDNRDVAAEADDDQPPPPSRDILDTPSDDPEVPATSSDDAKLV